MLYHVFVALRKGRKTGKSQTAVIFWFSFIVIVVVIFLWNRESIEKNFNLFKNRLSGTSAAESKGQEPATEEIDEPDADRQPAVTIREPASPQQGASSEKSAEKPASNAAAPASPPQTTTQTTPPATTQTTPPATAPAPKPAETRDRNIYFTQIDSDGQILRTRVTRKITVSEAPMQDALNTMLRGPNADELNKGMISLIPPNTRILSAIVRGNTAYINFSEEFQFNTFGVEGYAAQLRQIVWTVTEFRNVNDVQILIEGKRVDYLGEGIWIGSPIGRDSF